MPPKMLQHFFHDMEHVYIKCFTNLHVILICKRYTNLLSIILVFVYVLPKQVLLWDFDECEY